MAIRLTDTIETTKGQTTSLYLHITEYYRDKAGNGQFPVKYFKDETKAEEVKLDVEALKQKFNFDLSAKAGSYKIEKLAYDAIGAELKEAGLSPESDSTGSWVAY